MTDSNSNHQPRQHKTSLTVLVASTLGASLSAVPKSQEAQGEHPNVPRTISREEETFNQQRSPERRASSPLAAYNSTTATGSSNLDSGSRKRISLTRLHFNSKKSAGSESSRGEALTKQESFSTSPPAGASNASASMAKAAARQVSETSLMSDHDHQIGEEFPIPKSSTMSGLIPRAPTGSEWHRSKSPGVGERDVVPLHEVLKDLDLKAESLQRERLYSQTASMINKPVSWEEDTVCNVHLWTLTDSREACHLAETQYCQQQKVFHPKRAKLRCSACRILCHSSCIKQLYYEGYTCKDTFREIKQKVRETHVLHHFLHRRKLSGKCSKCDKGFGSWKKFSGREIVGYSCSWCGDSYHPACFNQQLKKEPCHFGPLRNLIIPPSWIVRTPPIEPSSPSVATTTDISSTNPRNSSRRKTRRSRRRKHDERASKHFTVKPVAQRQHRPLLVFLNPKSGGNQGAKLMQTFQWLLNPRQVFDLSQGGPRFGLKFFQNVNNKRILACGGDGTVGWILSILDELDIRPPPPIAVLPLGTGNDLSRVLKWGAGYTDEPLDKILMHVEEGPIVQLDRWHLNIWENPQAPEGDHEGVMDVPLKVVNNYFSVGADAQIALEFHNEREANPEKLNNQFKNKFFYFKAGGKDLVLRKFSSMTDHITIWCDGEDLTPQIRSLRLEAICFLNIPSYGAGTNPWGTPSSRDKFKSQSMEDQVIEVVGFWSSTFGKLQMGIARGERIAQCRHIKMVTNISLPIQIDGEAWKLQPSIIECGLKNTVPMIRKVPRRNLETPLHGVRPSDRIKMSVSKVTSEQYERLNSDLTEIRRAAKPLGLVVATSEDTLKTIRPQIERYTQDDDDDGQRQLAKSWRFLDVATSGRMDCMFQVLPDQEDSISMGDILSDGLLVVELDPSGRLQAIPETPTNPQILFSPEEEANRPAFMRLESATERRQVFGRNSSYEIACDNSPQHSTSPVSPGPISPSVGDLDVPPIPNPAARSGDSSSPTQTPVLSEEESPPHELPHVGDTGSDSQGTDTDVSGVSGVQKSFLDAVKRGQLDKVKAFHQQGAKLTMPDSNGWTPLHHAARLGRTEVVQYIAENIPRDALDIVEDEKLQTALHKAAWFGYKDICKILIEKGASPRRTDYQYNTPYDKAIQFGDIELQQYLKQKSGFEEELKESDEVAI